MKYIVNLVNKRGINKVKFVEGVDIKSAQAKAEAKFRTEKGGVEVYGKLDTTAINRIFALDPTIKTWDDFQRRAKIEIERVAAGSGDSTFSSGLVSHQKITDGKMVHRNSF